VQNTLGKSLDNVVEATGNAVDAVTDYVNKTAQSVGEAVDAMVGDRNMSEPAETVAPQEVNRSVPVSMPKMNRTSIPRGDIATH